MSFPNSHKTVIVLDHSPAFLHSSQQLIDFDIFTKNRAQGFIPLAAITKTLWTANVEAAIEYGRIVYDLFPSKKLIQLVSSDCEAHTLNSWSQQEQNLQQLMNVLAKHGPPKSRSMLAGECDIFHGLSRAIETLCEASETQQQLRVSRDEDASDIINKGTIICLTSLKSDSQVKTLEECMLDNIVEHNKLAAAADNLIPLTNCELILVHVVPVSQESTISHRDRHEVSPLLSTSVHVSQSGRHIAVKMVELVMKNFGLASTTVTGIPMKEEQNASSSANYDVELLHASEAHKEFLKSCRLEGLVIPSKEGLNSNTVTLKWCTPKSNAMGELQQCTSVDRITPVDVNSRPSSCLTNFLLNGRAVMLEQPRKSGARVISHILASHGGEIYIHTLAAARFILEDPPSISEGCGGRVTDYRINDFGELMKLCRPAPITDTHKLPETPIERQKAKLERMTRHWPMTFSDTIIHNIPQHLEPLPALIQKETLTEAEVLECKKAILQVVSLESRNEALPVPTSGARGKGPKREEQYRQMWSELEKLVRCHLNNSPAHEKVLECLLECKRPTAGSDDGRHANASPRKQDAKVKDEKPDKTELEKSLQDFERFQKMTEREKEEMNKADIKTSDSPPPSSKKPKLGWDLSKTSAGAPQSLFALWTNRISTLHTTQRSEFAGRQESSGNKAELYLHMKEENNGDTATEASNTNTSTKKK